jgi:AAA15 family ATPase/GTPase
MIETLRLENFQAHDETILQLHPGVNVIAGSSNSGKSSILRALNWLIYNRPSGEAFVSHWARDAKGNQKQDTSITAIIAGIPFVRKKSKTTGNSYHIADKTLEAVGLDVPEEISTALNMSEVNTQRQHDSPFLLSESPGEVARFFNKIVHFDAIDTYLSTIESKKRKTKAGIEARQETIDTLQENLKQYTWAKKAETLLADLAVAEQKIADLNVESLDLQIKEHARLEDMIVAIDNSRITAERLIASLDKKIEEISKLTGTVDTLRQSLQTYAQHEGFLTTGKDVGFADKLARKLDKLLPNLITASEQVHSLASFCTTFDEESLTILESVEAIADLTASLPNICPTCGKELS